MIASKFETISRTSQLPMLLLFGGSLLALLILLLHVLKKNWGQKLTDRYLNPYYDLIAFLGLTYLFSGTYWHIPRRYYRYVERDMDFNWERIIPWLIAGLVISSTQLFWFSQNRYRPWLRITTAMLISLPIYYSVYCRLEMFWTYVSFKNAFDLLLFPYLLTYFRSLLFFTVLLLLYALVKKQTLKLLKKRPR